MLQNKKGFTLIELLIAIAVIAILAAIAVPAYGNYMVEARRNAVKQTLNKAINILENCYTLNHNYVGCLGEKPATSSSSAELASLNGILSSEDLGNYYEDAGTVVTASNYILKVNVKGSQKRDTQCLSLLINRQGIKASSNSISIGDDANTDSGNCW
jgi:type IV pilus assembly protein PilE